MRTWLSVLVLGAAACGGASNPKGTADPEPPPERDPRPTNDDPEEPEDVQVEGLLGTLDVGAVQPAFQARANEIEGCYRHNIGKNKFVGGRAELRFRIATDGTVKKVHIVEGDLGAWAVEKCLLTMARTMTFPKPKGGEAEFRFPIDFPGRGSVMLLDPNAARVELEEKLVDLEQCTEAGPGPDRVQLILYMGPGGVVRSAGFVTPEVPLDDLWADCAVEKALAWKLTDPRGKIVKVVGWYPK